MSGSSAFVVPGLAALLAFTLACQADDEAGPTLDEREESWHAQQPERYVVQTCTLGIEPPGCVRAVVDGGEVTAAEERIFDPGVPWWEAIELDHSPLDQMFDWIRAGEQDDCSVDEIAYEAELGYVERYTLDCEGSTVGGRWVACFEPEAQDLDACEIEP